jgi:hypothetical protein
MEAPEGRFYGLPVYGVPGFKFGKYHHFARLNARREKMGAVFGSAAICFAISRSGVAATRRQSTFERSRSALVRRTIGITLSPVGRELFCHQRSIAPIGSFMS